MKPEGSITHWINEIKDGNHDAAQHLWERYFARLVRLARKQISEKSRRVCDEEDIVVSVFETFFRATEAGRFPDLSDRDSLWRLLVKMTAHKSVDQNRKHRRLRRGGGAVRGESVFGNGDQEENALNQAIGDAPTPEFVAMMSEQLQRLLEIIDDQQLRELAIAKMEGYTNQELAEKLDCSSRTIERRLVLIRTKLKEEYED